jgi:hypothetical protein
MFYILIGRKNISENKVSYVRLRVWIFRVLHLAAGLFLYAITHFSDESNWLQFTMVFAFFGWSFIGLLTSRCEHCNSVWYRNHEDEDLRWDKLGMKRLASLVFSFPDPVCAICKKKRF